MLFSFTFVATCDDSNKHCEFVTTTMYITYCSLYVLMRIYIHMCFCLAGKYFCAGKLSAI